MSSKASFLLFNASRLSSVNSDSFLVYVNKLLVFFNQEVPFDELVDRLEEWLDTITSGADMERGMGGLGIGDFWENRKSVLSRNEHGNSDAHFLTCW